MSYGIRSCLDTAVPVDAPEPAHLERFKTRLLADLGKKAKAGYRSMVIGTPRTLLPASEAVLKKLLASAQDQSLAEPLALAAAGHLLRSPAVLPMPDATQPQSPFIIRQSALVKSLTYQGETMIGIGLLRVVCQKPERPVDADLHTYWYRDCDAAGDHLEQLYRAEKRRKGLPKGRSAWWIGGGDQRSEVPGDWIEQIEAMGVVAGLDVEVIKNPGDKYLLKSLQGGTPDILIEWQRYTNGKPQALVGEFRRVRPAANHLTLAVDSGFDSALGEARRIARARALGPPEEKVAKTVLEAVQMAQQRCKHLVFLKEAFSSAEKSNFPRPHEALYCLETADAVVDDWRAGRVTNRFEEAFRKGGLSCYHNDIGDIAEGKYRDDYEREYDGKKIMLAPHLSIGNKPKTGLRIYWWIDSSNKTFVIGQVGAKLGDRSNP